MLGWRCSAGGRLSGGAMLLGVTRMMHRSHVATGRRRGGASEQQVGRVVVERRGSRTVVRATLYRPAAARDLIAHSHYRGAPLPIPGIRAIRLSRIEGGSRSRGGPRVEASLYAPHRTSRPDPPADPQIADRADPDSERRTRQRINVNQLRGSRVPRSARARVAPARAAREVKRRSCLVGIRFPQCDRWRKRCD